MYKTILVHVDGAPSAAGRLQAAALLARSQGARLVGLAVSGRLPTDFLGDAIAPGYALPPTDYGPATEAAQRQLAAFDDSAGQLGVSSREGRFADATADFALLTHSRYCDLLVVSQGAMTSANPFLSTRLAAYLAVQGASPVLVIPHQWNRPTLGQSIIIGWNGSKEARHAIDAAMPLLETAARVQLVLYNAADSGTMHGPDPAAEMATMLGRHGVKVEIVNRTTTSEPGLALQELAAGSGADLIVAGAFGHSRLQEWFMGGSTSSLLDQMQVPVLLTH